MLAGLAARVKKVRTKFVVAVGIEIYDIECAMRWRRVWLLKVLSLGVIELDEKRWIAT